MSNNTNVPILEVKNLQKHYPVRTKPFKPKRNLRAVEEVSFSIEAGQTYGLVGESGCGKSTTGRTLMRLHDASSGTAYFNGQDLLGAKGEALSQIRRNIQMIFQDPYSSLDPRKRVGYTIGEPLKIHGIGTKKSRREQVMKILEKVGFSKEHYDRFPHEFSGGQRQRIGLARALVLNPSLVICDEPVSALDVSIQSQIMNLLKDMQKEFGLSYLFIAHDLSVVRYISDRIGVMYLGRIVEQAPTDELMKNPLHPYTQSLFSAIPVPKPRQKKERILLKGSVPSPLDPPKGCSFHTRCPYAMERCKTEIPQPLEVGVDHIVECHLYDS